MTTNRLQLGLPRLMGRQIFEFKWFYLSAVLCMFLTHRIQVELPFMAKELGDLVVSGKANETPFKAFIFVALAIILFRTLSRALFFYPARVLQGFMMEELTDRLEEAHPYRYKTYSSGQLYQTLQVDIQQLRAYFGFGLLQITNFFIAIAVLLPKLVEFEPKLVKAFIPLLISVAIFTLITSSTQKLFRKIQDYQGDVQNFLIESFHGKKSIKKFHSDKYLFNLFEKECQKQLKVFFKATIGPATAIPLIQLGVGLSFLWGAYIIFELDLGATSLITFSAFVFLFLSPLLFISWIGVVVARTWGSWKRIKELLHDLDQETDEEKKIEEENKNGDLLEFNLDIWNKNSQIKLKPNEWTALIGETGSGKSYIIDKMAVVLNKKGKKISYVTQEPYLFNDSIRANIFLGKIPDSELEQEAFDLLVLFGLDILSSTKSNLLNLEVGENGKRVSGGQAKRIALVRSLISKAPIILWDDPFSSVDLILEKEIIENLKKGGYFNNKTLILTSHRLSTVRFCEHILYIEKEQGIKEEGEQQELLIPGKKTYEHFKNQII